MNLLQEKTVNGYHNTKRSTVAWRPALISVIIMLGFLGCDKANDDSLPQLQLLDGKKVYAYDSTAVFMGSGFAGVEWGDPPLSVPGGKWKDMDGTRAYSWPDDIQISIDGLVLPSPSFKTSASKHDDKVTSVSMMAFSSASYAAMFNMAENAYGYPRVMQHNKMAGYITASGALNFPLDDDPDAKILFFIKSDTVLVMFKGDEEVEKRLGFNLCMFIAMDKNKLFPPHVISGLN